MLKNKFSSFSHYENKAIIYFNKKAYKTEIQPIHPTFENAWSPGNVSQYYVPEPKHKTMRLFNFHKKIAQQWRTRGRGSNHPPFRVKKKCLEKLQCPVVFLSLLDKINAFFLVFFNDIDTNQKSQISPRLLLKKYQNLKRKNHQ